MEIVVYKNKIINLSFFLGVLFIMQFLFPAQTANVARAGVGDALSGYAWSENIGWISFNCTNENTCATSNYGVNVLDGNFSGYAWSENIGWISFNSADVSGCPSSPCSPVINLSTGLVSGWAKALSASGGWDGWIKLSGTATNGSPYGVSFSGTSASGYSWGSDVIGWISWSGSGYGVTSLVDPLNEAPTTTITSPAISITIPENQSQQFIGTATDPNDGDTILAYEWRIGNCSTGAPVIGNAINFDYAFADDGVYTVYFRAQDNKGAWSTDCPSRIITVTVREPINGVCGSANGVPTQKKPTSNLCNTVGLPGPTVLPTNINILPEGGTPSSWTWTCAGEYNGANASCSSVNGSTGTSCGDGKCQPSKGESPATCRADCRVKFIEF